MQDIELLGSPGSPYTRKMIALLRYRRIHYRIVWGSHFAPPTSYPTPKVKLLPTFYFHSPNGTEAVVDSTPIIERLEREHLTRSVIPEDPLLCFLNRLIEDFADEWLTKAMFHYRWHYAEDAKSTGPLLTFWHSPQMNDESARNASEVFSKRQLSRLYMVGSSEQTAPVIEASYLRLIDIMDRIIARQGFLLGERPASADFAIHGQLTQLGLIDPTPARLLNHRSPRLRAWLDRTEDLSGHQANGWITRHAIPDQLGELLREVGRVYAPFLLANSEAYQRGDKEFETYIDDHSWKQPVFPYQVKCLLTLQEARLALTKDVRQALDDMLHGTGCELLFEQGQVLQS